MTFTDIIINPPFNIAKKESVSGTGGDATVGRRFRKRAVEILQPEGNLGVICMKSVLQDVVRDGFEVVAIDLMTEEDIWQYNTSWSIESKIPRTSPVDYGSGICGKMFGIGTAPNSSVSQWQYHEFNSEWHYKYKPGSIHTLVELPQKQNNFTEQYAMVNDPWPACARFAFTLMESARSYTVSDKPYAARMSGWVEFDSIADATVFSNIIRNNSAVRYFEKFMRLKSRAKDCSRFMKLIDLSQFVTGAEYAREWNFTEEEIAAISSMSRIPRPKKLHHIVDADLEKSILDESKNYALTRTQNRQKELGEIFTPTSEVIQILKHWPDTGFQPDRTWLDMAVGNGQLLAPVAMIKKALGHANWLETIYATDIDAINVDDTRQRLSDIAGDYPNKHEILSKQIVQEDALKWNYNFHFYDLLCV